MRSRTGRARTHGAARVSGIAVLAAIVVVGLVTGVGFYRYKRGQIDAALDAELAAAPRDPAQRAALWLEFAGPQIHHRLAVVARFTPAKPWLVTHAVADPAGGEPELWGIDCESLPKDLAHLEGMTVVVDLPHPRALGHADLAREGAERVPLYDAAAGPDPVQRLAELARYLLEEMPAALARDVPGASLEIRVAP